MINLKDAPLDRRRFLRHAGQGLAAVCAAKVLSACGSSTAAQVDAAPAVDAKNVDAIPLGPAWASGGTAAMTDVATYPNPFPNAVATCAVLNMTTAGPCTTATTMVRQDVSEGFTGLPIRLALRLVSKTGCTPIAGATIEIWHTNAKGVYSGVTPNPQLCYGADPSAANNTSMRGSQITDANGDVAFHTCFPGWYPGRAIHIHFRVFINGTVTQTSQLFFAETLTTQIFAQHIDYKAFGQPNTSLATDGIIRSVSNKAPYILDTAIMPDGAMLASKVLAA
jgi:protocatechuate 3,4-dioxygenase beta subunit